MCMYLFLLKRIFNKFRSLLQEKVDVISVTSKVPTISILNVTYYSTEEDFLNKIKNQNPVIKDKLDNAAKFSIIYSRKPKEDGTNFFQIVAHVDDVIRQAIKSSNDQIYMDLTSHRVIDRFYIKRCNQCQHYEKDCSNLPCCGYCGLSHLSKDCSEVATGDCVNYYCVNCSKNIKK